MPAGWTETIVDDGDVPVTFDLDGVCAGDFRRIRWSTQATCTAGEVTVPTVVLATGPAGVTYAVDPPGPYDGHGGHTVTVTATLADGYAWGTLWRRGREVERRRRRTRSTLHGTTCDEVTPVAPTVNQAVCRGGVLEPPTLELADDDGITYTADPEGPYAAGERVTVTATFDDDRGRLARQSGRAGVDRDVDSTTATFEVTFADVACTPVVPVDPTVTQATCTDGEVTVPTVTPGDGPAGVTYT